MLLLVLQRLFWETLLDLVSFPFWWYSFGLKRTAFWCADVLRSGNEMLSPGLWLMYGQYDIQGRFISFFIRLIQVIARSLALAAWLVVCLALFLCWLALPILVVYGFVSIRTV
jgi:hypothetical protein